MTEATPEPEPAWLTAKADQRIALMVDKTGGVFPLGALVVTPLTEPREGASKEEQDRWDRSCDNCGKFLPEGKTLFTGHLVRRLESGVRVAITFGACATCAGRGE